MIQLFLSAEYAPFTIAFVVMLGVGLIEAIGLGVGQFDLHADIHGDVDGAGSALDWLGIGAGLPILIWLTSLLGCFTIVGIALQQGATALAGAPLAAPLAGGVALVGALIANSFAASGLARIMPGYESTIVSSGDLVRLRGLVLEGSARRGHPARAKVVDRHGQAHYVMLEPHHDTDIIASGATALIVRKEGGLFFALPDTDPALGSI